MSEIIIKDSCRRPRISEIQNDSRRSWLVCLGAAILVGFSVAINNSFGVLFVSLLDEFDESRSKIAWIGSFAFIWSMLISPVCHSLTQSYGFRPVVFVGAIFFSLGFLSTSFANHVGLIYITYGLLLGTGTCLLYIPAVSILPYYFHINLSTAYGMVISTDSLFTLWFAPVYEHIIRKYGWRLALKILTVLIVPLGFACCFFPKKEQISLEDEKESKTKLSSSLLRVVKNQAFVLWVFIMFLVYLGQYIPLVYLISFSKDIGIPTDVSVYTLSCLWAFDGIGKLVMGKLLDTFHWNIFIVNSLALLTMAVVTTLLPLAKTVVHLFLFSSFYGLALGTQCVIVFIISPRLCQPEDAKQAIAYLFAALSIPGGVGPIIAAWIYDTTKSYHIAFSIAGGFFAAAAFLGVILPHVIERGCCSPLELRCENQNDLINNNSEHELN